ncbi:MAG: hypothetical protein PVJ27_12045, partial [Candidatus Brocadiaceae bacterium]
MKVGYANAWLLALTLGAFLVGCAGVPDTTGRGRPGWVGSEAARGAEFVSAIGYATPDAEDPDERADLKARQAFAAAVSDRVTSDVTAFLREQEWAPAPDDPLTAQFRTNLASEVSAALLRQTAPTETWHEPDGGVYVLYRVPVEGLNERILARGGQLLAHQNPFAREQDRVVEGLRAFLAARTREQRLDAARVRPRGPEVAETDLPPEWLETGRHPDFPADRFVTAIGLGQDPEVALEDARNELTRQLTRRLLELYVRLRSRGSEDALGRDLRALGDIRPRFGAEDLVATRIVAEWHHPVTETHFALAALDRRAADIILRRRIRESLESSASLAASAANNEKAENWRAALGEYLEALRAAQRAALLQVKAWVLAPEAEVADLSRTRAEPLVVPLRGNLAGLLARLDVVKVTGRDQWLPRTAVPHQPFVVKVTAGPEAAPVSNVPVRFCAAGVGGRLLARGATDAGGVTTWRPDGRLPGAPGGGSIAAALDLQEMAPELDLSDLDVPR